MKREKNGTRISFGDNLETFLKRKEEDEATGLMEEMRKNVVAARQKIFEAEQSLCNAPARICRRYDRDQGSARTLMTKCWQSIQTRGTKNMNLEKDLEDMHSTARRVCWCEEEKTTKLWEAAAALNFSQRWNAQCACLVSVCMFFYEETNTTGSTSPK